ncbi:hypothetical protein C0993_000072 [Termitomyces sp. T159_Od127]|nr:hypothetical protein C0993_000072 [Termitomyces sp. T159_Od127]
MPSSELSNALNPYANQRRPAHVPAPPYVSELHGAVAEPQPPPPRQPNPPAIHAVHELLRFVAAERTRRLQWEHDQEAKYAQQHADMERRLQQLTQEVITLRNASTPPVSPSPSPRLDYALRKKRQSSELDSDSASDSSSSSHRVKRTNHHDTRCLTIHVCSAPACPSRSHPSQHAMRAHILLMMKIDTDKQLPESHVEGVTLGADDPVRFVWDKTTKQSVHNTRMKTRVLADIKDKRKRYKHVPDKDFGKKNLEACFEACFVTLRQKFKAQHNPDDAQRYKKREDVKARRARHVSRKKLKLTNRAEARLKVDALEHVIFDGALQTECMSSDDSEDDNGARAPGMLYTRGHQWRSSRLKRFYDILDEGEKQDKYAMPKRGVGKKERSVGPLKDFALPPERVATWMISKRWIKASQAKYPDLLAVLEKRIEDPPGFDWEGFDVLGEESDELAGARLCAAPRPSPGTPAPARRSPAHAPRRASPSSTRSSPSSPRSNKTSPPSLAKSQTSKTAAKPSKTGSEPAGRVPLTHTHRTAPDPSPQRIEKPLAALLSDITVPPAQAALILDSPVGDPWLDAIADLERRLVTIPARSRVKAARDLGEVAEGLRIVAATKIRAFFLALFQPIRGSVATNMQVLQTSVLLKYAALFAFVHRQAPDVAHEIQRSYVAAARVYYETGFRRYIRSLTWIKVPLFLRLVSNADVSPPQARFVEKHEPIVASERAQDAQVDLERLAYAKIVGPGVTLAYMADDKSHTAPIEALLRSLLLVFMDNATSEYTFLKTFFSVEPAPPTQESPRSPPLCSPDRATFADQRSASASDCGAPHAPGAAEAASREAQAGTDALWKQSFLKSALDPVPPAVPLLTMIRVMEDVVVEVQKRACPPVESYVFGLRLTMWPVFQKVMAENVDAVKKLAEGGSSGYFSRAVATTDAGVSGASPPVAFLPSL